MSVKIASAQREGGTHRILLEIDEHRGVPRENKVGATQDKHTQGDGSIVTIGLLPVRCNVLAASLGASKERAELDLVRRQVGLFLSSCSMTTCVIPHASGTPSVQCVGSPATPVEQDGAVNASHGAEEGPRAAIHEEGNVDGSQAGVDEVSTGEEVRNEEAAKGRLPDEARQQRARKPIRKPTARPTLTLEARGFGCCHSETPRKL